MTASRKKSSLAEAELARLYRVQLACMLRTFGYGDEEIRECTRLTDTGLRILALEWAQAVDKKYFVSIVGKSAMPKILRKYGEIKREKGV